MKDEVDAVDHGFGDAGLGQVALDEFDFREMCEVSPFPCDEAVDDAHAMAAAHELLGQVRADESSSPGDEIRSHQLVLIRKAGPWQTGNESQGVAVIELLQGLVGECHPIE